MSGGICPVTPVYRYGSQNKDGIQLYNGLGECLTIQFGTDITGTSTVPYARYFSFVQYKVRTTQAPNTDPMELVQLNLKPICIFKYGNQLYNYITHRAVVLYNCDPYDIR